MMTTWPSERLKRVADVTFSSVDKKTIEGEVPVKLCNYTDVYYRDEITADLPFMEATATDDQIRSFSLQAGDVLITKDSETANDIGVPAFVPRPLDGVVCGYHLAVVRPRRGQVDPKYLFWVLSSHYARDQMGVLASGVTRFGLRLGDVGNLRVFVPPLAEQRAIVNFLDLETGRIDATMIRKRRLFTLLAERLESLRARWVEGCFDRFGEVRLRRLASQIEQGWSPNVDSVSAEAEEWGILKTSAITTGTFRPYENKRLPQTIVPHPRWVVHDGDLLVTRGSGSRSNVGRAVVAATEGRRLVIPDLVYRVRLGSGLPSFVAHVMSSARLRSVIDASIRTDAGQTLKIRSNDLADLPIPAADPAEQAESVRLLEKKLRPVQQAAGVLKEQLELLAERRQALIEAVVSGRIPIGSKAP
jgi:type I restriction enzyme S subunit